MNSKGPRTELWGTP